MLSSSVCGRRTKSCKFVKRQVSFAARTSHPVSECVGGSRPGCHQPFPSNPASRNASSEKGQTRHFDRAPFTSDLPRQADIISPERGVEANGADLTPRPLRFFVIGRISTHSEMSRC